MEDKYWIKQFKESEEFKNFKFKKLKTGYPQFIIDEDLIDEVELEEFIENDNNRLPFFIGSQFGINQRIDKIPGFNNKTKIIAILNKSLLSGCVAGLCLYYFPVGALWDENNENKEKIFKIAYFRNII